MNRFKVLIAVATVATGGALLIPTVASAHANSVQCVDQATSTWRITNDHPLAETFTSTEGVSGSVAAGNGSFTDVVWNGDSLHVTGTWTDGFVGETDGFGDCSPEVQPTTTELVTTTTAQETTTSPSTSTSTSVPATSTEPPTTSTTTPTVNTTPTTTLPPSVPSSTLPPPSSAPTTPPPTSTPSVPPTSTPTPCTPPTPKPPPTSTSTVTSQPAPPSAPSCGQLPATGNPDLSILTGIAAATIVAGAFMLTKTRR